MGALTSSSRMTFIGGGRACIGFKFSQLEMSGSFAHFRRIDADTHYLSEVILYSLIRQFRFTPPKQEIYWQMTFIASPTTDPTLRQLRPSMPLTVSIIEDA